MNSQSIKEKLAALAESNKPVPELNLLRAAIPFIIYEHKKHGTSQTIHYLLEYWWKRQPHIRDPNLRNHCIAPTNTCCYGCGQCFSSDAIFLIPHCKFCDVGNRSPSLSLYFLLDFLNNKTDIPRIQWERLIANYLYTKWIKHHEQFYGTD